MGTENSDPLKENSAARGQRGQGKSKSRRALFITGVLAAGVLLGCLLYGCLADDRYIPTREGIDLFQRVREVTQRYISAREDIRAVHLELNDRALAYRKMYPARYEAVEFRDSAVIDNALLLSRAGVDALGQGNARAAGYCCYTIRYTLNSGRRVARSYIGVPIAQIAEPLRAIETSPVYIAANAFLLEEAARCTDIVLDENWPTYRAFNAAQRAALMAALREDIWEYGMAIDSPNIGTFSIDYAVDGAKDSVPIYLRAAYSRTTALLKSWDVPISVVPQSIREGAKRLELLSGAQGDTVVYSTEDPARIAELLDTLTLSRGDAMSLAQPYILKLWDQEAPDAANAPGNLVSSAELAHKNALSYAILYGGPDVATLR